MSSTFYDFSRLILFIDKKNISSTGFKIQFIVEYFPLFLYRALLFRRFEYAENDHDNQTL